MLLLALLLGQALGLPEVENPIPDKIGLEYIFAAAGAGGVIGGVLSVVAWPRRRERFISLGTFAGCCIGFGFYALSLSVSAIIGSMKSFVRKIDESDRWFALVIGVLVVALMLAAEATNELAYLLVLGALAIQYARKWMADRRKKI